MFIGATNFDRKFRAFDKRTGKLLWETTLPMSGNATPITYELNGKQYVVIYATKRALSRRAFGWNLYCVRVTAELMAFADVVPVPRGNVNRNIALHNRLASKT